MQDLTVDLTRKELGMVTNKELVEVLEERLKIEGDLMKEASMVMESRVFEIIIRTLIETFKDKLVNESQGREADLLNRGAISGIKCVFDTTKQVALDYKTMTEKPRELEGAERFRVL